jgi:hypothetical protein
MATSGKCHFLLRWEVEWNRVELSGTKGSREPRVQHELGCMSYPVDLFFVECLSVAVVIHPAKVFELHWIYVASSDGMRQHLLSLVVYSLFFFFWSCQVHHTWHRPQDSSLFTHVVLCFLPSHFLNFIFKKFQVCLVVLTIEWIGNIAYQPIRAR